MDEAEIDTGAQKTLLTLGVSRGSVRWKHADAVLGLFICGGG